MNSSVSNVVSSFGMGSGALPMVNLSGANLKKAGASIINSNGGTALIIP